MCSRDNSNPYGGPKADMVENDRKYDRGQEGFNHLALQEL